MIYIFSEEFIQCSEALAISRTKQRMHFENVILVSSPNVIERLKGPPISLFQFRR